MYFRNGSPRLTSSGLSDLLNLTFLAKAIGVPFDPLDNLMLSPNTKIGCVMSVTSKSSNTNGEAALIHQHTLKD